MNTARFWVRIPWGQAVLCVEFVGSPGVCLHSLYKVVEHGWMDVKRIQSRCCGPLGCRNEMLFC